MTGKYTGLPGDMEIMKRTWAERFERQYGKDANARAIYLAHPDQFLRFAKVFPRLAYLLEQLQSFYEDLGSIFDLFDAEFVSRATRTSRGRCSSMLGAGNKGQVIANDPFEYFAPRFNYNNCFLHLRAALRACSRDTEPLLHEIAQDVLDIFDDVDRKAIMEDLLSAEVASRLMKHVPHTNTFGIWAVRSTLAREEATFARNAGYIRAQLSHEPEMARKDTPIATEVTGDHVRQQEDNETTINLPDPTGDDWTFTPSSSAIDGPEARATESAPSRGRVNFEEDLSLEGMAL